MNRKCLRFLAAVLFIILGISGCAENRSFVSNEKSTIIATSFYPMYISTLNITKDIPDIKVINMTKPVTGCLHDYAITPADLRNLEGAQYFVINGAGMESFMEKVTGQMPNLKIINASKGIQLIKSEGDEGDNPHVWVSISNAIIQVKNIGDQLSVLDPENAAQYQTNTVAYIEKLETQKTKMHQVTDNFKNRDIITFHEAFPYFAKEFNLNIVGVIKREPNSEPSAKELKDIIEKIRSLKVKVIFVEPQYPAKVAETIAEATSAKVYILDPVVTGPMDADAYINIMKSNLKTLQEALE
ncbi:MAG: metal ABC transporter substrate-binding protein [Desulfitobacteriaceae bacterium]|nr:metal ABC transporter substrate-binding protein [Desulfitobacteriaceae bacterium]MDD4346429.1 metal ABC transporter substrate-binding protein [Desulfitobacteriaceae bacterium]MDD4400837.1 metal ABC transporter substrate-binding protein [Desulfitobacteriaceae bacterium]